MKKIIKKEITEDRKLSQVAREEKARMETVMKNQSVGKRKPSYALEVYHNQLNKQEVNKQWKNKKTSLLKE